jgi:parallel beta-helix repeat protein
MSSQHRRLISTLVVMGVAAIAASPAAASPPATLHCGQTLTHSVKLKVDLVNCPGDGLVIEASGITVDLHGHTIDGLPASGCDRPPNPTTGVLNTGGYDRITVENGTIQQFDNGFGAGSATEGTSDSRIHGLVLRDNRFAGVSLGSGAGPTATARNRVDHNVVSGSLCDSGIKVNTGQANRFSDNRIENTGTGIVICCGEFSDGNLAEGNRIHGTAGQGVLVFQSGEAHVTGNALSDIGDGGIVIVGPASANTVVAGNTLMRVQFEAIRASGCPECGAPDAALLSGVRVEGNTMRAIGDGIILEQTEGDVVRANSVTGAASFGDPGSLGFGVLLDAGVSHTVVRANTITDGGKRDGVGILVGIPSEFDPSAPAADGNLIARNVVIGQHDGDGILVADTAKNTVLRRNTTNRNDADGIHVMSASTTLRRNTANGNGAFGIEAVPGVTDAGGNEAHGNGNPAQCIGVACA